MISTVSVVIFTRKLFNDKERRMDVMTTKGDRIKVARLSKGMTQTDLLRRVYLSTANDSEAIC